MRDRLGGLSGCAAFGWGVGAGEVGLSVYGCWVYVYVL